MKKIIKLGSILLTVLFMSILVFSLSSKVHDPGYYGGPGFVPCDVNINDNLVDAQINVQFQPNTNNPYRNPIYEDYIPSPDLRFAHFPGATSLSSDIMNYYCAVVISVNGCDDWEWSAVFNASNASRSGIMDIKLPPSGYGDLKIKVTYYERSEDSYNNAVPDFNKQHSGNYSNQTRVVFRYEKLFMGWGNTAQVIELMPYSHISTE